MCTISGKNSFTITETFKSEGSQTLKYCQLHHYILNVNKIHKKNIMPD